MSDERTASCPSHIAPAGYADGEAQRFHEFVSAEDYVWYFDRDGVRHGGRQTVLSCRFCAQSGPPSEWREILPATTPRDGEVPA